MKSASLVIGTVVLSTTVLFLCNFSKPRHPVDLHALQEVVEVLSSQDFNGRNAGSIQDSAIASYIANRMASYGFEPYFSEGSLHRFRYRNWDPGTLLWYTGVKMRQGLF